MAVTLSLQRRFGGLDREEIKTHPYHFIGAYTTEYSHRMDMEDRRKRIISGTSAKYTA